MKLSRLIAILFTVFFASALVGNAVAAPHNPCLDRPVEERVTGCSTASSAQGLVPSTATTYPFPPNSGELVSQ